MAKTKMKRTVGRRRKSGKKTSTSTRNKKRKNVIRGGLPLVKSVAILSYLFGEAKNKMSESVKTYLEKKTGGFADTKVQFEYLNTELRGSDGDSKTKLDELLKIPPDFETYPELAGYDWKRFEWAKFISDDENASTIEAMEEAAKKGDKLDKAVDREF